MEQRIGKLARWATGALSALVWGGAVAAGMIWMLRYQMTPGTQQQVAPHTWPTAAGDIARVPGRFTLVMTLHPQCPCSVASLSELSQLMSRAEGRMDVHILFVKPHGAPANWCDSALWHQAKEMPGVTVSIDEDAKDAAIFGATTSGEVLVYDAAGAVRFTGGITDGRGHEGDNAGLSAILSLIRQGKTAVLTTPVYGCSLGVCTLPRKQ